jgi:hypothetical protein
MAEGKGKGKEIDFTVVVNGALTEVKAHEREPLAVIIPAALDQTGNMGQPAENWELRDDAGKLLDPGALIEDFGFDKRVRLFLNLKAGVGG